MLFPKRPEATFAHCAGFKENFTMASQDEHHKTWNYCDAQYIKTRMKPQNSNSESKHKFTESYGKTYDLKFAPFFSHGRKTNKVPTLRRNEQKRLGF